MAMPCSMDGLKNIHTRCYDRIGTLDTTYFNTNVRMYIDNGVSKATMTASALA